jgi:DeoR family transcriptional regulator of aga operon
MKCEDKTIVVADRSKFSRMLFTEVIPLEEVDHIITDSALPEALADKIVAKGIELTIV